LNGEPGEGSRVAESSSRRAEKNRNRDRNRNRNRSDRLDLTGFQKSLILIPILMTR